MLQKQKKNTLKWYLEELENLWVPIGEYLDKCQRTNSWVVSAGIAKLMRGEVPEVLPQERSKCILGNPWRNFWRNPRRNFQENLFRFSVEFKKKWLRKYLNIWSNTRNNIWSNSKINFWKNEWKKNLNFLRKAFEEHWILKKKSERMPKSPWKYIP